MFFYSGLFHGVVLSSSCDQHCPPRVLTNESFIWGVSTIFDQRGTPFVYLLLTNGTPFIYFV